MHRTAVSDLPSITPGDRMLWDSTQCAGRDLQANCAPVRIIGTFALHPSWL